MLIDMNTLSAIVEDLNAELHYKWTEEIPVNKSPDEYDYLMLHSNGKRHVLKFLGVQIYDSEQIMQIEQPSPIEQINMNEHSLLEGYVRSLIQDQLNILSKISVI